MNIGDCVIVCREKSHLNALKGQIIAISDNDQFRVQLNCGLRVWLSADEVKFCDMAKS